ncbi:MAG: VWA domain-containing protein [Deltaproteobacteria bacterium]|nr:VWA domain-containing protein [Deltaproteobacteria bacterium]
MRYRWPLLANAALTAAVLVASCQDHERPARGGGPLVPAPDAGGDGFDPGTPDGPPPLDAPGLCGNELHEISYEAPNVYFVLDRSGSMAEPDPAAKKSRYAVVREAALDLVRSLGTLINVGAAVFPRFPDSNPCHVGGEVFPTSPGDPNGAEDGPTTQGFAQATDLEPNGGTPIAATLTETTPIWLELPGRTVVLLLTDGVPNCNEQQSCGIEECIPNIEKAQGCDAQTNCCAPDGPGGPENCVDRYPTLAAIHTLRDNNIEVYVIGIPGSAFYADLLDEMAVAAGTAKEQSPKYYRVDDLALLGAVFASIAAQAISCEFPLADPPAEKGMTNVYLDGVLLPFDPVGGWSWKGDDTVWLHGEACQKLKTGGVALVQVVSGCPTEVPK